MRFDENTNLLDAAIRAKDFRRAGDVLYEQFGPDNLPWLSSLLPHVFVHDPDVRADFFDPVNLATWLNWHACAAWACCGRLTMELTTGNRNMSKHARKAFTTFENLWERELRCYLPDMTSSQKDKIRSYEMTGKTAFQPHSADAVVYIATHAERVLNEVGQDASSRAERRILNKMHNRLLNLTFLLLPLENIRSQNLFPRENELVQVYIKAYWPDQK